ncbi:MAG TPA: CBS domain-containing protein [Thiotrichaceae bacterium]|jgi:CBS domain-containing protein|nr:CBS domain-containing protein [Thiotrichaceae bacterium]HIM07783.1 CBS domain-containing protein [Gammaproteobacteria bacterium]
MTTTVNQLLNGKDDEIYSVKPDTFVIDAIRMLNEQKVGALLVLENDKLAGIFSERDYTRKVILNDRNSSETKISEIMTSDVQTVAPSQTIDECMVIMSNNHIRHLPVLKNGEPVGILSIMDVVKNIISEKEFIIEQLEHYITDTA